MIKELEPSSRPAESQPLQVLGVVWLVCPQELFGFPDWKPFSPAHTLLPLRLRFQPLHIHDKDPRSVSSLSVLEHTKESTKLANDSCLLSRLSHGTHRRIVNLFWVNLATRDYPAIPSKGRDQQNLFLFSRPKTNTGRAHSKSILVVDCLLFWLLPLWSSFAD